LNILIITQARVASTRLPNKILLEIKGKALLDYHLRRLTQSSIPICVATSTSAADDILCAHLTKQETARHFRGSELDVLSRFYQCAKQNHVDIIIRVTSDCPLIDGNLIKDALETYQKRDSDSLYLSNTIIRTFPRGFDFEIFSFAMLEQAFHQAQLPSDREHVTTYIRRNIGTLFSNQDFCFCRDTSHLRLTVDEPADFLLIKALIAEHGCDMWSAEQIITFLEEHPELAEINRAVEQKKSPGST